ncbi:uncharacterized protein LOC103705303 [Phoenix dactylifera]|uniref:Uncharacterized protein LOC103705303 n=1 Tax=Phoenix dactylifera TaxID=42345 RepID=A0A8B7BX63_PHODC|nr:uncharacterized protein LOC103705303 [Phoenix dactylifera]
MSSRREGRDSHAKRPHSRSERESSPKKTRRDGKPATERTNRDLYADGTADQDQKQRRRLQDVLPLEAPPAIETKLQPDNVKKGSDRKFDEISDGTKHSSDPAEVPRSRSYFQHDERGSAGQGGRSYRKSNDHGWRSDPKEQSGDRVKDKAEPYDLQKKDERTRARAIENNEWKHDGFFELEAEKPPARKRPAFREQKMPAESESAAAEAALESRLPRRDQPVSGSSRREERGGNYSRGLDKPERPFNRDDERNDRRGDVHRAGYQSRDRFGGRGMRGRERFSGRYGEGSTYRQGGFQVEKWKHDLFDEANRSPTPKNEEEQIAKVEALLAL